MNLSIVLCVFTKYYPVFWCVMRCVEIFFRIFIVMTFSMCYFLQCICVMCERDVIQAFCILFLSSRCSNNYWYYFCLYVISYHIISCSSVLLSLYFSLLGLLAKSVEWIISISEQTFPLFVSDGDTRLVAGYNYLSVCFVQKIVVIYC